MIYMNDYDMIQAQHRAAGFRRTLDAIQFLLDFKSEVDAHSDGWAYWRAPVAAAQKLQALIQDATGGTVAPLKKSRDITEAEFKQALSPIKNFYTRAGTAAGMSKPRALCGPSEEKKDSLTMLRCADCGRTEPAGWFNDARNILQRHAIGDTFSDKECADCGALAFPVKT